MVNQMGKTSSNLIFTCSESVGALPLLCEEATSQVTALITQRPVRSEQKEIHSYKKIMCTLIS